MKKQYCAYATFALFNLITTFPTLASEGYYLVGRAGAVINKTPKITSPHIMSESSKYTKYPSLEIGVGKFFDKHWGAEIDISHDKYNNKKLYCNKIYTTALHVGAIYKFVDSKITPFIVLGGGLAYNKISELKVSNSYSYRAYNKLSPSYYGGLGLEYQLLKNVAFNLSYRYTYMGTIKGDEPQKLGLTSKKYISNFKINSQKILFGVKYNL